MSAFAVLDKFREEICRCRVRFDWQKWFELPLADLSMSNGRDASFQGTRLSMICALQAMKYTGGRPSVAKLIAVATSPKLHPPIRAYVAHMAGEHLATCLLNAYWDHHAMLLELVQAAHAYQLSTRLPEHADDGRSFGFHAALATFVEHWLLSQISQPESA